MYVEGVFFRVVFRYWDYNVTMTDHLLCCTTHKTQKSHDDEDIGSTSAAFFSEEFSFVFSINSSECFNRPKIWQGKYDLLGALP